MGSNWHVKREQPTIAELTTRVAEALKEHGEYSREYRNTEFGLRIETRKLDAAKAEDARRKALDALTPKEIVDRIMER